MKQQSNKKKIADQKKMIKEANERHDREFGANPIIVKYATHVKGRKDISNKR
jgi:hypothetical protein